MRDVEAQAGLGQDVEDALQLRDGTADGFTLVHVLDEQKVSEVSPAGKGDDGVGMDHYRPSAPQTELKTANNCRLIPRRELAGRMDRDMPELRKVQGVNGFGQVCELFGAQGRQFNGIGTGRLEDLKSEPKVASGQGAG
ncbi:MAG: hypothetical protein P4L84_14255 [Isosphaeraceae bacterium]|nr:hypothetical protein [Isosphaeraceae bacterium]